MSAITAKSESGFTLCMFFSRGVREPTLKLSLVRTSSADVIAATTIKT